MRYFSEETVRELLAQVELNDEDWVKHKMIDLNDYPSIEIKEPHGKVIDIDAFLEAEKGEQYVFSYSESVIIAKKIYYRLQNAPTVLEASKETD